MELFWAGEFERIDEAFAWEKRLQGWSHAKREAFAAGGLDAVVGWSARQRRLDRAPADDGDERDETE